MPAFGRLALRIARRAATGQTAAEALALRALPSAAATQLQPAAHAAHPHGWPACFAARSYAKKAKKGATGAPPAPDAAPPEAEPEEPEPAQAHFEADGVFDETALYDYARKRMEARIAWFADSLAGLRTGRASPAMLERLPVQAYDTKMLLQELATVTVSNATTLSVTPYDPGLLDAIGKAISDAPLGLNPVTDGSGTALVVPVPPPSAESKAAMRKQLAKMVEETKVRIRSVRQRANGFAKASEVLTPDEEREVTSEVQVITDDFVKVVADMQRSKEADL